MLKHRDVVQIITTKRIIYVSGPSGQACNPKGNWIIVGFIGNEALIAKDSTLVKVPVSDVRKIASFGSETFAKLIANAGYKKEDNNG